MSSIKFPFIFLSLALTLSLTSAQSPEPIVVQAATPPPARAAAALPAPVANESIQEAAKALQDLKAQNDDVLKKQEAALQRLDELQQAAEQLRVYAKRG